MWTEKNRSRYNRDHLRYPSDVTDEEWELIAPLIPSAKRGGGKRRVDMRAVMPRSTVNRYFCDWSYDGTLDRIHHALYLQCREKLEREASPTACIVDSQSVKSAEKGGRRLTRMALTRAS